MICVLNKEFHFTLIVPIIVLSFGLFANNVNSQMNNNYYQDSISTGMDSTGLSNAMRLLPQAMESEDIFSPFTKSYISSRLRSYSIKMQPRRDERIGKSRYQMKSGYNYYQPQQMLGSVPLVEPGESHNWIPGELIVSMPSKMQLEKINQSEFGPIMSVTIFPAVMTGILVFSKPYNSERLAEVLKINFGVESEPNGIIFSS